MADKINQESTTESEQSAFVIFSKITAIRFSNGYISCCHSVDYSFY